MTSYDLPCIDMVVQIRTSAKEIVAHLLDRLASLAWSSVLVQIRARR